MPLLENLFTAAHLPPRHPAGHLPCTPLPSRHRIRPGAVAVQGRSRGSEDRCGWIYSGEKRGEGRRLYAGLLLARAAGAAACSCIAPSRAPRAPRLWPSPTTASCPVTTRTPSSAQAMPALRASPAPWASAARRPCWPAPQQTSYLRCAACRSLVSLAANRVGLGQRTALGRACHSVAHAVTGAGKQPGTSSPPTPLSLRCK
jgi:hypothetical protein